MVKLELSLKRVQTFIFEVPKLKAMLGANALIGQTMRYELPRLVDKLGLKQQWPADMNLTVYPNETDPLQKTEDPDNPSNLYSRGMFARDGGHFSAIFEDDAKAQAFIDKAAEILSKNLPGVLYEINRTSFPEEKTVGTTRQARDPQETHLLDLPVLQICQKTGREPASDQEDHVWQARSVTHRLEWGEKFYNGRTKDIIGLMRAQLYPKNPTVTIPFDLTNLCSGDYLALFHADGNGIGKRYKDWKAKIPKRKDKKGSLEEMIATEAYGEMFFHSMRVAVRLAVVNALQTTFPNPGEMYPYKILMLGGDDLLLICQAKHALDLAVNYAKALEKYVLADGAPLDVAIGIAIAKHKYPLHRLHELAESLASSAKRLSRASTEKMSVIDWQIVTQSWFEDVAKARQQSEQVQYTIGLNQPNGPGLTERLLFTRRPYPVLSDQGLEGLIKTAQKLDPKKEETTTPDNKNESGDSKAARSPLRSLRHACERGRLAGEMAFKRLPESVQVALGSGQDHTLWQKVGESNTFLTHALDVIGIREIAHLGTKS